MQRSRKLLVLNAAIMALAIGAWGALPAVSWADHGSDRDSGDHGGGDRDNDHGGGDGDHGGGDGDHGGGDGDHGGGDGDHGGGDSDHGGSGGDRDTDHSGSDRDTDTSGSDRDTDTSGSDRDTDTSGSDHETDTSGSDHDSLATEDRSGSDSGSADRSGSDSGSEDRSGSDSGSDDRSGSDSGSDDNSGSDSGSDDHSGSDSSGSGSNSGSDDSGSGGETDAEKAAEDAAKDAEDAAKETAKAAEDAAKDAEKAAEDAAKAAADAQKEADKAAEDAAKQSSSGSGNSGSGTTTNTSTADAGGSSRPIDLAYDQGGREYRAGELVLVGDARTLDAVRSLGLAVVEQETLATLDTTVVRVAVPADRKAETVLAEVRAAAPGAAVDLNSVYRLAAGKASAARGAAARPVKSFRGTVGVIDTAVDRSDPRLAAAIAGARSFATGPAEAPVHGTIVVYQAVNAGARVVSADVFSLDRNGAPAASADAMARAVDWLIGQGVSVINLSLAGPPNRAVADVVRRAQARGVIVVAAAGNAGPAAPPAYPGAYPQVVAVTAVDGSQQIYRYANRGGYIMFAARGVDITGPKGGAKVSGTSYAAPVVAAMLAAQLPRQDAAGASKAIERLRRQARDVGAPGRDPVYGFGVINQTALRD